METDPICQDLKPSPEPELQQHSSSAFQPTVFASLRSSSSKNCKEGLSNETIHDRSHSQHSIPHIELGDIEAMFEGVDGADKKISSLLRDHLADVDEPIWINLLTTVYNSLIPKKQAAWIVKEVGDYVRSNFDPNSELKDYQRIQRKAVLIGYTILAILELKNSREDDIFSPDEKYFFALTEKGVVKEGIKIGLYTQKMIEKSVNDKQEKDHNYKVGSLFTKFFKSVSGDRSEDRRKMLMDWTSIERMNKFEEKMSDLDQEETEKITPSTQIPQYFENKNEEKPHQIDISQMNLSQTEIVKPYVKEVIVLQPAPEHEATSCDESSASQPLDFNGLKVPSEEHLDLAPLIKEDPQEQVVLNELQNTPVNRADEILNIPEDFNIDGPGEDEAPEREFLCSTADTLNINLEQMNADTLPQIQIVFEQEQEQKEAVECIKVVEEAQKVIERQHIQQEKSSSAPQMKEQLDPQAEKQLYVQESPLVFQQKPDSLFSQTSAVKMPSEQAKIEENRQEENRTELKPATQENSDVVKPVVEEAEAESPEEIVHG